jgi:hypothetical protein
VEDTAAQPVVEEPAAAATDAENTPASDAGEGETN